MVGVSHCNGCFSCHESVKKERNRTGAERKSAPVVSQSGKYKVHLNDAGYEKIKAIKEYREFTGVGLKEAKDMIDAAPCTMLVTTDYQKARRMADEFRAFGANVSIFEE